MDKMSVSLSLTARLPMSSDGMSPLSDNGQRDLTSAPRSIVTGDRVCRGGCTGSYCPVTISLIHTRVGLEQVGGKVGKTSSFEERNAR